MTGTDEEYTAREIRQQPVLWREVAGTATLEADEDARFLDPLLARENLRIVLTGAGTSAFAGEVLAPYLRRALRRRIDAVATTDIVADPRSVFAEDVPTLLVSFARSGDSPESVAATELATQLLGECFHLIVTCNPDGTLSRVHRERPGSRVVLMPAAANDRGFAMTSSFSCMTLAVLLRLGRPDSPEQLAGALAESAQALLERYEAAAAKVAAAGHPRIVYLGSGSLHGLAQESALKALELTAGAVVAVSESALGFRHGPKAVLTPDTLAVVYVSNDPYTRQYDLDIVRELADSLEGGELIAVTTSPDDVPDGATVWSVPDLTGVPDAAFALPAILCAQLIGLQFSRALGLTPDNPFPGGEVNRVVQGVTVHPLSE